jgi:hypothetical protein
MSVKLSFAQKELKYSKDKFWVGVFKRWGSQVYEVGEHHRDEGDFHWLSEIRGSSFIDLDVPMYSGRRVLARLQTNKDISVHDSSFPNRYTWVL